jgi:hypothetical protein
MDERLRFLGRVFDGESMTEVCRDFGISRKSGYKIFDRYKEHGLEALADRSRRPVRFAINCRLSSRHASSPSSARSNTGVLGKSVSLLVCRLPGDVRAPAKSTIHAVLHRHGLVIASGRPRRRATGTPEARTLQPFDNPFGPRLSPMS